MFLPQVSVQGARWPLRGHEFSIYRGWFLFNLWKWWFWGLMALGVAHLHHIAFHIYIYIFINTIIYIHTQKQDIFWIGRFVAWWTNAYYVHKICVCSLWAMTGVFAIDRVYGGNISRWVKLSRIWRGGHFCGKNGSKPHDKFLFF